MKPIPKFSVLDRRSHLLAVFIRRRMKCDRLARKYARRKERDLASHFHTLAETWLEAARFLAYDSGGFTPREYRRIMSGL
jgi:hypothetical protein